MCGSTTYSSKGEAKNSVNIWLMDLDLQCHNQRSGELGFLTIDIVSYVVSLFLLRKNCALTSAGAYMRGG